MIYPVGRDTAAQILPQLKTPAIYIHLSCIIWVSLCTFSRVSLSAEHQGSADMTKDALALGGGWKMLESDWSPTLLLC